MGEEVPQPDPEANKLYPWLTGDVSPSSFNKATLALCSLLAWETSCEREDLCIFPRDVKCPFNKESEQTVIIT
jgi:hypothetical protein